MKETKYIPGDLVMFKNPFEPSDTCVGIVKFLGNISDIILLCPYTNLNLEYFIKVENIQGIPITPEIIEKNGWKHACWSRYHKPAETNISLVFYQEEKAFFLFLYEQEISETPIRYIHQLQHLLFGLGMDSSMIV